MGEGELNFLIIGGDAAGMRLHAKSSASRRVRILIRIVLGMAERPPPGKKYIASRFCSKCSSRKNAMVTVIRPILRLLYIVSRTICVPDPNDQ